MDRKTERVVVIVTSSGMNDRESVVVIVTSCGPEDRKHSRYSD